MSDDDLLLEAVAELYSSDPDEFIKRRDVLAAQARQAGVPTAAKQIAGLRKPTRSAWTVNQLVRAVPGVTSELAGLGDQLRAAQRSLDGAAIRDLSLRRHRLIDALTRQAFKVSGQQSPPAALREEVAATLGAALADPEVAERLQAGTLERAARTNGFATAGPPVLTLVPSPSVRHSAPVVKGAAAARVGHGAVTMQAGQAAGTAPAQPARPASTSQLAVARAKAERDRRCQSVAEARQVAAEAGWALDVAVNEEREQEDAVRSLEEQLAEARLRLADARLGARQARTAQRQARQELERLLE